MYISRGGCILSFGRGKSSPAFSQPEDAENNAVFTAAMPSGYLLLETEMPIEYTVSSDGMFVHAIGSGVVTVDEVRRYMHDIAHDDCVKPGFRELFDAREITESRIVPESFVDIHKLVLADPKRKRGNKMAIVVGSSSSFHNAKRYERLAMSNSQNVIVFNDVRTAKIWLGAAEMRTEPVEQKRG